MFKCISSAMLLALFSIANLAIAQTADGLASDTQSNLSSPTVLSSDKVKKLNADLVIRVDGDVIATPKLSTLVGGVVQFTAADASFRVKLDFLEKGDPVFDAAPSQMKENVGSGASLALVEVFMPSNAEGGAPVWHRIASPMIRVANDGSQATTILPMKDQYLLDTPMAKSAERVEVELRVQEAWS
ncbi:MAG: hypothetical protein AAF311_04510 [Pseudomonadota bacterium]